MNLVRNLPLRDGGGRVLVVVETPARSRVKLKYDEAVGGFIWSRALVRGTRFPYDFGFLPRTLSEDRDALDALVVADEPSFPGVVVPSRIVGAMRLEQQRDGGPIKRNDRIIAIPAFDRSRAHIAEVADLPQRVRDELEAFFHASLALTGKNILLRGWADAAEAAEIIAQAEARFSGGPVAARSGP